MLLWGEKPPATLLKFFNEIEIKERVVPLQIEKDTK